MIRLVTDSSSYVPAKFISAYDIREVPLTVHFGEEVYDEISGISNQEFFRRLATTPNLPTTSQPSAGEFKQTYQQILNQNPEATILVITVSSKLSGTYGAAVTAARQLAQANITVFDSLSAAMGTGLMAITAGEMASQQGSLTDILTRLTQMRRDTTIVLMVDNLNYLKRGGRIGAASSFFGTLLNTKPILAIVAGHLKVIDRARTKKRALHRVAQLLAQTLGEPDQPVQAGLMHVDAQVELEMLARILQKNFNITRLLSSEIGPVIGAHLGPGAIGAGICPEPR